MIKESGRVLAVEDGAVWVEIIQRSACSSCSSKAGCGQSPLSELHDGRRHHFRLSTAQFPGIVLCIDDPVDIGLEEQAVMRGILWIYVVPLVAFIAGAILGVQWLAGLVSRDLAAIGGGLAGFVATLLYVRQRMRTQSWQRRLQPVLLGRSQPCHAKEVFACEP